MLYSSNQPSLLLSAHVLMVEFTMVQHWLKQSEFRHVSKLLELLQLLTRLTIYQHPATGLL